jgi:hypothetical protein
LKIRPLPEIDLARIAPLAREQKRRALEQIRLGRPPYSYAPLRGSLSDLTNVQADLAGPMVRTPWPKIAQVISRASKSDVEESANLRAAEGLFEFSEACHLIGRRHDIFPLALGVTTKVTYWQPAILTLDERPVIPFYDPRRAKALTTEGRRFVFSVNGYGLLTLTSRMSDLLFSSLHFQLKGLGLP